MHRTSLEDNSLTVAELRALLAALPGDAPVLLREGEPRVGRTAAVSVVLASSQPETGCYYWVDEQPTGHARDFAGPPMVALLVGVADPLPADRSGGR